MKETQLQGLSREEIIERNYQKERREAKIGRTRAAIIKKQVLEAYEILENIRFDYVSDTMFRDYIVSAKRELEGAVNDFLLSDAHWVKLMEHIEAKKPEEFLKESEEYSISKE